MITQQTLKEYLQYNQYTGEFTWIKNPGTNITIGAVAGCFDSKGYIKITILGSQTYGHRLAFLYMDGVIPTMVDHIDGNPSNNKYINLRATTHSGNMRNSSISGRNTTGVKGVSWNSRYQKYKVQITIEGKQRGLGYYSSLGEATKVIKEARERYHKEFTNHG